MAEPSDRLSRTSRRRPADRRRSGSAAVLLAAAALGLSACPSSDDKDCAGVGLEGCACTSGGRCDDGLVCSAGTCAPEGGTGVQPTGGALPETTFVFLRGKYHEPSKQWRAQLWSHDVVSRDERMITAFDDALPFTLMLGNMAVSPDRRWVAFAAYFRPSQQDRTLGTHTRILWKVSIDGQQFVRLAPAPPDPREDCGGGCDEITYCEKESNKCTWTSWLYAYEQPTWKPDGETVLFHLTNYGCAELSCVTLVPNAGVLWPYNLTPLLPIQVISDFLFRTPMSISDRPAATPLKLATGLPAECRMAAPTASPDGSKLAGMYTCRPPGGSTTYGLVVTGADGSNPDRIRVGAVDQFAWKPDGTGLYYSTSEGDRLSLLKIAEKVAQPILGSPSGDPSRIRSFAVSPGGRWLVFHQTDKKENPMHDIYAYDLDNPGAGTVQQLTTDGSSSGPAF